jgi:hypothetical protein
MGTATDRRAAAFYLLLAVIVIVRNHLFYNDYDFIWFCDIGLVFFSFGFMTSNYQLVKGLISIGLIAQFIFLMEFTIYAAFDVSLSSMPRLLLDTSMLNIVISLSIHLLSTNLALLLTYKRKTNPSSLIYSAAVIALLFMLSLALTPAYENVNYVFSSGFIYGLSIPFYTVFWPFLVFTLVVLPTYSLQKALYWTFNEVTKPSSLSRGNDI